jgi:hypothetical protein
MVGLVDYESSEDEAQEVKVELHSSSTSRQEVWKDCAILKRPDGSAL